MSLIHINQLLNQVFSSQQSSVLRQLTASFNAILDVRDAMASKANLRLALKNKREILDKLMSHISVLEMEFQTASTREGQLTERISSLQTVLDEAIGQFNLQAHELQLEINASIGSISALTEEDKQIAEALGSLSREFTLHIVTDAQSARVLLSKIDGLESSITMLDTALSALSTHVSSEVARIDSAELVITSGLAALESNALTHVTKSEFASYRLDVENALATLHSAISRREVEYSLMSRRITSLGTPQLVLQLLLRGRPNVLVVEAKTNIFMADGSRITFLNGVESDTGLFRAQRNTSYSVPVSSTVPIDVIYIDAASDSFFQTWRTSNSGNVPSTASMPGFITYMQLNSQNVYTSTVHAPVFTTTVTGLGRNYSAPIIRGKTYHNASTHVVDQIAIPADVTLVLNGPSSASYTRTLLKGVVSYIVGSALYFNPALSMAYGMAATAAGHNFLLNGLFDAIIDDPEPLERSMAGALRNQHLSTGPTPLWAYHSNSVHATLTRTKVGGVPGNPIDGTETSITPVYEFWPPTENLSNLTGAALDFWPSHGFTGDSYNDSNERAFRSNLASLVNPNGTVGVYVPPTTSGATTSGFSVSINGGPLFTPVTATSIGTIPFTLSPFSSATLPTGLPYLSYDLTTSVSLDAQQFALGRTAIVFVRGFFYSIYTQSSPGFKDFISGSYTTVLPTSEIERLY